MKLDQRAVLTGSSSPEQIRADIEETRERLAEIADKLTPRGILTAQAKQAIDDTRAAVAERAGEVIEAVSDRAEELAEKAPEVVSQAADEAKARKFPLGVVALAALAVVGAALTARRSSSP